MKQIKQLNLMCYKLEIAMSIDTWYFLHGTTEGRENIFYFLSLLSKMVTSDTEISKRGQTYKVKPGQVDGSLLGLSKEWGIGRKAIRRLLDDFSELGIIKVTSNPLTSIITMLCVKEWMIDGKMIPNPLFSTTVGKYEGVRIHLYNGQQFDVLRKSSLRKKTTSKISKTTIPQDVSEESNEDIQPSESKPGENNYESKPNFKSNPKSNEGTSENTSI